jgi:hypothetical protein
MRRLCLVAVIVLLQAGLAACTDSFAVRVDQRTFRIEGPPVEGGAEAPNRRLARRACPQGYRVLEETRHRPDPALGIVTYWTIRCL